MGAPPINSETSRSPGNGYANTLLKNIASAVDPPVIACGGAGTLDHLRDTIACTGVNAVAAGSMFVFHGKHKAVLINYPTPEQLEVLHLSHTTP